MDEPELEPEELVGALAVSTTVPVVLDAPLPPPDEFSDTAPHPLTTSPPASSVTAATP